MKRFLRKFGSLYYKRIKMNTGDIMRRRAVCISLDKELVKKLDEMKTNLSRSSYVEQVLMNTLGMQ